MKTSLLHKLFFSALLILPSTLFSQYQVNGNASTLSCNCYQLTPNSNTQSGSVWNVNIISLNQPFDFTLDIFLGCNNGGADGIVFGLQPVGTGIGTSGGGMGFQGVTPSVGFFIDTWQNIPNNDPAADHFSINANGDINHNGGANDLAGPASLPFNIEDCAWHTLRVTWDPATFTLQGYIDNVLYLTYTGNIVANIFSGNPNVFWGMTGATGGATNQQQFCTTLTTNWAIDFPDYACSGQTIQFSDSTTSFGQIVGWDWSFGDGNTSALQNPSHTYAADGVYNVKLVVTDASGCQDSLTDQVTVATPILNPTAFPSSICPGASTQVNAGLVHPFANVYDYTWLPAASLSNPTLASPLATPLATTMYYVSAVDPTTGCSADDSILIQLIQPPDLDPIANVSICESYTFPAIQGTNLTAGVAYYTGTGGTGTQYNSGDVYNVIGPVTLFAFDDNGCTDEESFTLDILSTPVVDLGPDITTCQPDTIVLAAGIPGATYMWNDNSSNATLNVSSVGSYWVEVIENGCSGSDTMDVLASSIVVTLQNDTTICDGSSLLLDATIAGASYLWNDNSTNSTLNVTAAGNYSVTTTLGICSDMDSVQVSTQELEAAFTTSGTVGCVPLEIQFTDQSTVNPGLITNWMWDFGNGQLSDLQNPQQVYVTQTNGVFSIELTVTSAIGCIDDTTINIQINAFEYAQALTSHSPQIATADQAVSFVNLSANSTSWYWEFEDGDNSTEENPEYTYTQPGNYTVTLIAMNANGCNDTLYYSIQVVSEVLLFAPNAFTPDGDEHNQTWKFEIQGVDVYDFKVSIFNGWGEMIWESRDPSIGWDGTHNGELVQEGIYTWRMEFGNLVNDDREIVMGHVNLMR
ncbi:MAG: PKD domain-containing protein [Crocinitomicaceae bacterium]